MIDIGTLNSILSLTAEGEEASSHFAKGVSLTFKPATRTLYQFSGDG